MASGSRAHLLARCLAWWRNSLPGPQSPLRQGQTGFHLLTAHPSHWLRMLQCGHAQHGEQREPGPWYTHSASPREHRACPGKSCQPSPGKRQDAPGLTAPFAQMHCCPQPSFELGLKLWVSHCINSWLISITISKCTKLPNLQVAS